MYISLSIFFFFFFFNDTATTEIYTLSLHDALPIWRAARRWSRSPAASRSCTRRSTRSRANCSTAKRSSSCVRTRSEEHTSELQSRQYLVCRLLLEKKKKIKQSD